MMILGIGIDLCDIRRIAAVLDRYGERFERRIFTDAERETAARRAPSLRAATYAKRFAAKEACSKALGTGFTNRVFHKDIGVVNLASGRPTLQLSGGAMKQFQEMMQSGQIGYINLTITDEHPYAFAQVMIWTVTR